MGACTYCGESAGFFRSKHNECEEQYQKEHNSILFLMKEIATSTDNALSQATLTALKKKSYTPAHLLLPSFIEGWENALYAALDDHLLSPQEEKSLRTLQDILDLKEDELNLNSAYTHFEQAIILRQLEKGEYPQNFSRNSLPFNLQKSEEIVWLFDEVEYFEEKKRIHYEGGSQGVNLRIAKGVYYRVGSFKGNRIETAETVHMDTGLLGITTKHIYFTGSAKSFRTPYRKIVSFSAFENGLGIQKDTQSAKPQSFILADAWFLNNLVRIMAQNAE
jgi:hypothetical protein